VKLRTTQVVAVTPDAGRFRFRCADGHDGAKKVLLATGCATCYPTLLASRHSTAARCTTASTATGAPSSRFHPGWALRTRASVPTPHCAMFGDGRFKRAAEAKAGFLDLRLSG